MLLFSMSMCIHQRMNLKMLKTRRKNATLTIIITITKENKTCSSRKRSLEREELGYR